MARSPKTHSELLYRIRTKTIATARAELEHCGLLDLFAEFHIGAWRDWNVYAFTATHRGERIAAVTHQDGDPEGEFALDGQTVDLKEVCRWFAANILNKIAGRLKEQADELACRCYQISID